MKKKILIRSIVLLVLIIVVVTYLGLYPPQPKVETLSNVTELYSSFTPDTKDFVNFYLSISNCKPTQYYFENSILCFKCLDKATCFKYIQNSIGQFKMTGLTFLKYDRAIDQKDAKVIGSFYTDDLTNFMSCESELLNETILKSYCPNFFIEIRLQENGKLESIAYILKNATLSNLRSFTESYYNFLIYMFNKKNVPFNEDKNLTSYCEEITDTSALIKWRCRKGSLVCMLRKENDEVGCVRY
ncbi:MAG: hypothetical protein QMD12_00845 [Candidatus Aenigmarchaeota archaeon]|nr:hypothetical protein [Candidatus Aenigmarchaeota archaeon]